jgi:hypothetical protein
MLMKTDTAMIMKVGFHLVSSEVINLTPEIVAQFRAIESSTVEREINRKRVKHLRDKVDAGLGVTFHWVTADLDGKTLRGNGQHSSTMLSEIPVEHFPKGLKVFREHYRCETADDFALLFQQFDDRKSNRTSSDVAAVYQGFQPELVGVPHDIAKLAIDGYAWFQRTVEKAPGIAVGDMAYALFSDKGLHPFIRWLAELHNSKTRELQSKPVTAAVFGTFAANETEAKAFWDDVSRGGDPDNEDSPQRVLDLWLRAIFEGTFEPPGKFGAVNVYQGCIYAWNAARESKAINTIKFEVKKNVTPIRE